jgi:RND family efflux transporter MFP subunit
MLKLPARAASGAGRSSRLSKGSILAAIPTIKPASALVPPGAPPQVPAVIAPTPSPRRWWRWATGLAMVAALAAVGYVLFWPAAPTVVAVEVATLAPVTRILAVNGRIEAVGAVDVRSVTSGNLIALLVAEGNTVVGSHILAQLDPAAQNAVVRQAVAGLDAALVTQTQAIESYDRAKALGANVARAVLEADAHAVQSAAQEVARQTAVLEQAQVALDNLTIRAPIAGTVLQLDVEVGQIVGPTASLLTLADLDNIVVAADVDEAYATQIALQQPAHLQLAGEGDVRTGHVSFVSDRVDVTTGGLAIEMAFDAPLRAPIGLTVVANIVVDQRPEALTVPRTALLDGAVFVVTDGTAQKRALSVVDWPADRLIAATGLEVGDVVITGASGVTDGQSVTVAKP